MVFRGKKLFNASFDVYADNYQQVRPAYPEAIFEDINAVCGVTDMSNILEIGSGSGIATKELAKACANIIALEPGENLAAVAKNNLGELSHVEHVCETFENYKAL